MLVIHPDECIDCGVCEPECPVDAIKPDTEPGLEQWLSLNAEYAKIWPNITVKKAPPPDFRSLLFSVRIEPEDTRLLCVHFEPKSEHREDAVNQLTAAIC